MTAIQTPLDFDGELMRAPAQAHSATSVAAALDIEPKAGTLRGAVLAHLRACGAAGATDEQIWFTTAGRRAKRFLAIQRRCGWRIRRKE